MNTSTVGGAMDGNWDTGNMKIASPPMKRMRIEMTMANAGRRRIVVNIVSDHLVGFLTKTPGRRIRRAGTSSSLGRKRGVDRGRRVLPG
jgi:hypothetical protein